MRKKKVSRKSMKKRKKKAKKPKGTANPNFMICSDKKKRIRKEHEVVRKIRYYWLLDSALGGCASKYFMRVAGWCHHYFQLNKFNINKVKNKNIIFEVANSFLGYNPVGNDNFSKEKRKEFYFTALWANNCLEAMHNSMHKINFERKTEVDWLITSCYHYKAFDYRCYKCRLLLHSNRSYSDLLNGRIRPIQFTDVFYGPEDLYPEEIELLKNVYTGDEGRIWEKAIKLGKKIKIDLFELMGIDEYEEFDIDPATNKNVLKDIEKAIDKKLRELKD